MQKHGVNLASVAESVEFGRENSVLSFYQNYGNNDRTPTDTNKFSGVHLELLVSIM